MILPPIYLELAIENIGFNTNSALRRKLFNQKAPGDSAAHTGMQADSQQKHCGHERGREYDIYGTGGVQR